MGNRMLRCIALIGTVLSLSSFAQVCHEVSLYKNGEMGKMEQAGMTFPESPEWSTNWGEMEGISPPYIRLSGMKDRTGDWTGALLLNSLPVKVQGGTLSFKVRSTQKGKFGIWLMGDFGNSPVKFIDLAANQSYSHQVSVAELLGTKTAVVKKVGIGLFDVPAYQYTTLFIDDVAFSCGVSEASDTSQAPSASESHYLFSDIDPSSPRREGKLADVEVSSAVSAAYSEEERLKLKDSTQALFVLSEMEHEQIMATFTETSMTPQKSRDVWFRNMYFVDRNRVRDSVIANPKGLFYEANTYAASEDNSAMPLLVGNVDYAYRYCVDTACVNVQIDQARLLQVGLPVANIPYSQLKLFYDPYYVSTNRVGLPKVEVYANGKWVVFAPKTELLLNFESAGVQTIKVKLSEGGVTVNQNLYVEVRP